MGGGEERRRERVDGEIFLGDEDHEEDHEDDEDHEEDHEDDEDHEEDHEEVHGPNPRAVNTTGRSV